MAPAASGGDRMMANEKRLIDANFILDEFLKRYTERERNGNLVFAACEIKQDFADMISNAPTVDAVKVVRCKDCIHSSDVLYRTYCGYLECVVYPHFFCAGGKKKGE